MRRHATAASDVLMLGMLADQRIWEGKGAEQRAKFSAVASLLKINFPECGTWDHRRVRFEIYSSL